MDEQESGAEKTQNNAAMASMATANVKKAKSFSLLLSTSSLPLIGFLLLAGIALMVIGLAIGRWGENTNPTSRDTTCSDWAKAPADYQDIMTKAANTYQIQPALVGAIFLAEHGGAWTTGPFQSSGSGAKGPFQFLDGTWNSNGVSVNSDGTVCCQNGEDCSKKPSCHAPDIQSVNDASFAAARYLQAILSAHVKADLRTTNETDIKLAAGSYNGGPGNVDHFRAFLAGTGNTNDVAMETQLYMTNAWKYFQNLNVGCASADTSFDKPDPSWDQSLRRTSPVDEWMGNSKVIDGTMAVSGVVLHWTAGDSVAGAVTAMSSKNSYVHLIIDKDGKVYQLLPLNTKVKSGSGTGNSFAVGIEIVGTGESDLLAQTAQQTSVVKVVKYLISTYNIPNERGNTERLQAHRGIFGHFQTQKPTGGEWGDNGTLIGCKGAKSDPGVNYLLSIWRAIGASDKGCIGAKAVTTNGKVGYTPVYAPN